MKAGRKKADRKAVFKLLALEKAKREIKEETGISERTYFNIKKEFENLTEEMKNKILGHAKEEEKEKANFEDYEIVQKWLKRISKLKSASDYLAECKIAWLILQKKNPANWAMEDMTERVLPEMRKRRKGIADFIVKIRSLRPDFKFPDKETGEVLTTKGEKYPINWSWKVAYEKIVQGNRLEEFFKSAGNEAFDVEIRRKYKTYMYKPKLSPEDCECLVRNHVEWGCREGSKGEGGIMNTDWSKINWEKRTIDIYESKVHGGVWWLDCPMDLFGDTAYNMLKARWEQLGKPAKGKIFDITYNQLRFIYARIAMQLKEDSITPHFARKLHASLLAYHDVPLEIVAGDHPKGLVGTGWLDVSTLKKFYITFAQKKVREAREKARQANL